MELPISLQDLDAEKIGDAFVRFAVVSHVLGHESPADTAMDYLIPHADKGMSPEARLVVALFGYPAREVLIEHEVFAAHAAGAAHMLDDAAS
jgi:hypothetical protein